MDLLCMTLSIRAFRGEGAPQPLILYIPCIILVIGHIHQKMHAIQHKLHTNPSRLKHVSAPRCHPQGVTNILIQSNTKQYALQAPTHQSWLYNAQYSYTSNMKIIHHKISIKLWLCWQWDYNSEECNFCTYHFIMCNSYFKHPNSRHCTIKSDTFTSLHL